MHHHRAVTHAPAHHDRLVHHDRRTAGGERCVGEQPRVKRRRTIGPALNDPGAELGSGYGPTAGRHEHRAGKRVGGGALRVGEHLLHLPPQRVGAGRVQLPGRRS